MKFTDGSSLSGSSKSFCVIGNPAIPVPTSPAKNYVSTPSVNFKWTQPKSETCGTTCSFSYFVSYYSEGKTPEKSGLLYSTYTTIDTSSSLVSGKISSYFVTTLMTCGSQTLQSVSPTIDFTVCSSPQFPTLHVDSLNPGIFQWEMTWSQGCSGSFHIIVDETQTGYNIDTYLDGNQLSIAPPSLGPGTYMITLVAFLTNGLSSQTTSAFKICYPISPSAPLLADPSSNLIIRYDLLSSSHIVSLSWQTSDWGVSCTSSLKATYIYVNGTKVYTASSSVTSYDYVVSQPSSTTNYITSYTWKAVQSYSSLGDYSEARTFYVCLPKVPSFISTSGINLVMNSQSTLTLPLGSVNWGQSCTSSAKNWFVLTINSQQYVVDARTTSSTYVIASLSSGYYSVQLTLFNLYGTGQSYTFYAVPDGSTSTNPIISIISPTSQLLSSPQQFEIKYNLTSWGENSFQSKLELFTGTKSTSLSSTLNLLSSVLYTFSSGTTYFAIKATNLHGLSTTTTIERIDVGTCVKSSPSAPSPILPKDGSFIGTPQISFSWLVSTDIGTSCNGKTALTYRVTTKQGTVTTSSNFITDPRQYSTISFSVSPSVYDMLDYQICASNNGDYSACSTPLKISFCDVSKLTVVSSSPLNTRITSFPTIFSWKLPVVCAQMSQYIHFQGSSTTLDYLIPTGSTSYTFNDKATFSPLEKIWWWISLSFNGVTVNGPKNYFQTCSTDKPYSPTLISPDQNALVNLKYGFTEKILSLYWEQETKMCNTFAPTYTVWINGTGNPNPAGINVGTTPSYIGNSWITASSTVNWRVSATNSMGTSTSNMRTVGVCISKPPTAPILISPLVPTSTSQYVTFTWNETDFGVNCFSTNKSYTLVVSSKSNIYIPITNSQSVRSYTLELVDGSYTWKVIKTFGDMQVTSSTGSFTLCVTSQPSSPSLLGPSSGSTSVPEFSWYLDSWGKTCSKNTKSFTFCFGKSPAALVCNELNEMARSYSLSGIEDATTYYWMVSANNGDRTASSSKNSFTSCVLIPPSLPTVSTSSSFIQIPVGGTSLVTFYTSALPSGQMGSSCKATTTPTITFFDPEGNSLGSKSVTSAQSFSYTFIKSGYKTFKYTVTNSDSISTTGEVKIYACRDPQATTPTSPFDGETGIDTTLIPFQFTTPADDFLGYSCNTNRESLLSLTLGIYKLSNNSLQMIQVKLFKGDAKNLLLSSRLQTQQTYFWKIISSNGDTEHDSTSITLNFTTKSTDCTTISCGTYGECEEIKNGAICQCDDGTTGTSTCAESNLGLSPTAISIIGASSGFLFIMIIVILFMWRKKFNRMGKLEKPDFDKFRFTSLSLIDDDEAECLTREEVESKIVSDGENDFDWSRSILSHTQITEADRTCTALVYLFEQKGLGLQFILSLIHHEVQETESIHVLFRSNSNAAKCFRVYARMIGLEYLFSVLAPLLRRLILDEFNDDVKVVVKGSDSGIDMGNQSSLKADSIELNPDLIDGDVDMETNILSLQVVCHRFASSLMKTKHLCPLQFKQLCTCIAAEVKEKFPSSPVSVSIASFMFLRFFVAGISVPETFGILPKSPSKALRRKLILISKVVSSISTQVFFGTKEDYMISMNEFLRENTGIFDDYICEISEKTSSAKNAPRAVPIKIPEKFLQSSEIIAGQAHFKKQEIVVSEEAKNFWNS
eukprot:TRINITY_DN2581_c0_g1_i4.p1 TRINITY_DN2581_c0_g1~~TRINITY_DN2581_c0_g1_i4.p1  ORF type:complete len:1919 (-),score=475.92 TRINITY_DN2581_c0_g1_i4:24-5054(-)